MKFLTVPISKVLLTGDERISKSASERLACSGLSMHCRPLVRQMGLYSSLRHPLGIEVWRCRAAQDTKQTVDPYPSVSYFTGVRTFAICRGLFRFWTSAHFCMFASHGWCACGGRGLRPAGCSAGGKGQCCGLIQKLARIFLGWVRVPAQCLILLWMQFGVSLRSSHFTHCLHEGSDPEVARWCADMPMWAAIVRSLSVVLVLVYSLPNELVARIKGKLGFLDFLVSRICWDIRGAGVSQHKQSTPSAQQIPGRVTSALGFHAERSSNACPGPPPHRRVVDLKGIDNIKPLKIVSSLSWSQCDHFVFRSSRITSTSFRKLVEEVHSVLGNIQIITFSLWSYGLHFPGAAMVIKRRRPSCQLLRQRQSCAKL